jgi:NAD dependent epimerase/dehydratase family enzyme
MFGELAKEALLTSQRAVPARLQAAAHEFRDPDLGPTLVALMSDH